MRARNLARAALLLTSSDLAACADLAPHFPAPTADSPTESYREVRPWTPAAPADTASRGRWWHVIHDPELEALETRLDRDDPTLAAAFARYDQAVALLKQANSGRLPELDVGGEASHIR